MRLSRGTVATKRTLAVNSYSKDFGILLRSYAQKLLKNRLYL